MANIYTRKSFLPKTTNNTDFGYLNGTYKFHAKKIKESTKDKKVKQKDRPSSYSPFNDNRLGKKTASKLKKAELLIQTNFTCNYDLEKMKQRIIPQDETISIQRQPPVINYSMQSSQRQEFKWPKKYNEKYQSLFQVDKHLEHNEVGGRSTKDFVGITPTSLLSQLPQKRTTPYEEEDPTIQPPNIYSLRMIAEDSDED